MSKKQDPDSRLLTKNKGQVDQDHFEADKESSHDEKDSKSSVVSVANYNLKPPEKLNKCQWVIVGILYLIFAFLVGFIIYISCTWNKDRTNEYT